MHAGIMAVATSIIRARVLTFCAVLLGSAFGASAHPHVFVDGGVSFRFRDGAVLESLLVTWRYDAFETLYILSSHGISLNDAGGLDEADRLELVRQRSDWPEDFDGSAHLVHGDQPIALEWPRGLDAHLVNGRLEVTFERLLSTPLEMRGQAAELGFYESTYFFAFTITDTPEVLGPETGCAAQVIGFDADEDDTELQAALAKLGREETPDIKNVGALFADRIILSCD